MISAILEILFLLAVSCLIGMVFTWLFWRSKYRKLQQKIQDMLNELQNKGNELREVEKKLAASETENQKLNEVLATKDLEIKKPVKSQAIKVNKEDQENVKKMKEEMEAMNHLLEEKERELQEVSRELDHRKISYYRQIDGKRYKALTLSMADDAIAGQGDGRISKEDAQKIFATISDGKAYTQVEKDTMRYLRVNYNWTEGADELFRKKVRSWAAKGHVLQEK